MNDQIPTSAQRAARKEWLPRENVEDVRLFKARATTSTTLAARHALR
jgi:hypothetical protein